MRRKNSAGGRPPKPRATKLHRLTTFVLETELNRLYDMADEANEPISAVARRAVRFYLDHQQSDEESAVA